MKNAKRKGKRKLEAGDRKRKRWGIEWYEDYQMIRISVGRISENQNIRSMKKKIKIVQLY